MFFLPRSTARSPKSRLATSSLANFVSARTTHSLILIELYLPSLGRFLFASRPRIRAPRSQRPSPSAVYVSFFLTARKIVASSKMLVAKSLLPAPSSRSRKGNSNAQVHSHETRSAYSCRSLTRPFRFLSSLYPAASLHFSIFLPSYIYLPFPFRPSHRCRYGHSYLFSIS